MKKERTAIYIRVSSEEQVRFGDSLEAQEEALTEYAKQHNLDVQGIYRDEGHSARKPLTKRDVMQQLLADIERDQYDLVIFTKIDRWFRSVGEYHKVQEVLDKHNVVWRAILEDYNTATADGRLKVNIMLSVAENEADRTSERIKFVQALKLKNKEPITHQPWGYKIVRDSETGKNKVIKDPELEDAVNDMFEHFRINQSIAELTEHMNNKYGKNHEQQTYSRRLKHIGYTGMRGDIIDYRPPYITLEQHNWIVDTLAHKNIKSTPTGRVAIFSRMVICPECGCVMSSGWKKGKTPTSAPFVSYRCNGYYNKRPRKCTNTKIVQEKTIERYLLHNVKSDLQQYIISVEYAEKQAANKPKPDPGKYEAQLKRLNNMYLLGNIGDDEYMKKTATIKNLIMQSRTEQRPVIDLSMHRKMLNTDFENIYSDLTREEKRRLWRSVVKTIHVINNSVDYLEFY